MWVYITLLPPFFFLVRTSYRRVIKTEKEIEWKPNILIAMEANHVDKTKFSAWDTDSYKLKKSDRRPPSWAMLQFLWMNKPRRYPRLVHLMCLPFWRIMTADAAQGLIKFGGRWQVMHRSSQLTRNKFLGDRTAPAKTWAAHTCWIADRWDGWSFNVASYTCQIALR